MKRLGRGGQASNVDHDHNSGTVRGLLHTVCNQALGVIEAQEWPPDAIAKYLGK